MSVLQPGGTEMEMNSIVPYHEQQEATSNAIAVTHVQSGAKAELPLPLPLTPNVSEFTSSQGDVNASAWSYALVLTGRLYAVCTVPVELRGDLHEGDLVTCEGSRGGGAGTLIKDVTTLVTAPGAMRDRTNEVAAMVSQLDSAVEPALGTGPTPSLVVEPDAEQSAHTRPGEYEAGPSGELSSSGVSISRTTSTQFSSPTTPLYSRRVETGLQMDQYMIRLPRIERRGVNRDKKKLYFSQRRGAEALQCVLQKLEERTLSAHLLAEEVEYQVDFISATVHLSGHPNEHGFSHEQYHRFGQLLLAPLRTQMVEFRHSRAFPEQLNRTRHFFSTETNNQLRSLVEEYEKRTLPEAHSAPASRANEQSNSTNSIWSGATINSTQARAPQPPRTLSVPQTAMALNTGHSVAAVPRQPVSFPHPMQMVQIHPGSSYPSFFPNAAPVQTFYTPLGGANGNAGLPMFISQPQTSTFPSAQPPAGSSGITFVEMPPWQQMQPAVFSLPQPTTPEFGTPLMASQPSTSANSSLMAQSGVVPVAYQGYPAPTVQPSASSSGSSVMFYYQLHQAPEDSFRPEESSSHVAHTSRIPQQPSSPFHSSYILAYSPPPGASAHSQGQPPATSYGSPQVYPPR